MSTNFYVEDTSPRVHIGKTYSLGRYCGKCNIYMGASACDVCKTKENGEELNRVGFIWAQVPTEFMYDVLRNKTYVNEYGEKFTALAMLMEINKCFKQEYESIGTEFS